MLKKMPLGGFIPPSEIIGYAPKKNEKKILAAFSGGADSSLMLHLLRDWCAEKGFSLYAAHVNHGIRGEEAIRDRDFCSAVCQRMGIELFILNADVPAIAKKTGKSIESAARDVRYDFFAEIMRKMIFRSLQQLIMQTIILKLCCSGLQEEQDFADFAESPKKESLAVADAS